MGERNRFAFDRDYYNRIAAEYVNGSSAKKYASNGDDETDIEEYLTATYAPEYMNSYSTAPAQRREPKRRAVPAQRRETTRNTVPAPRRTIRNNVPASEREVIGNTVPARRSEYGYDVPERAENEESVSTETKPQTRIKTRYLVRINLFRSLIVAGLIFLVVQVALNLLSVKSDVNLINKEIANAKITLEDVNSYNESLLGQLDISYDRNYIYNVAVGKLGMVYPKDNEVVYYKAADTSHVIQYRDIS